MSLAPGGSQAGYTPSIAPSERSNVGMPSRYRPVNVMDGVAETGDATANYARTQTMSSMKKGKMAGPQPPLPLAPTQGNAGKTAKNTIRVIERSKGSPNVSRPRMPGGEDEDDEEGWAEMRKKRDEMRKRRNTKIGAPNGTVQPALADIYQTFE